MEYQIDVDYLNLASQLIKSKCIDMNLKQYEQQFLFSDIFDEKL